MLPRCLSREVTKIRNGHGTEIGTSKKFRKSKTVRRIQVRNYSFL